MVHRGFTMVEFLWVFFFLQWWWLAVAGYKLLGLVAVCTTRCGFFFFFFFVGYIIWLYCLYNFNAMYIKIKYLILGVLKSKLLKYIKWLLKLVKTKIYWGFWCKCLIIKQPQLAKPPTCPLPRHAVFVYLKESERTKHKWGTLD